MKKIIQKSINIIPWGIRDYIKHIPGLSAFQRWLIKKFISTEIFVHKINAGPACGLKMKIKLPEDKSIWTGKYENFFIDAIAKKVKRGAICFDIGGYHGFVGGVMGVQGAKEVILFEPMPSNVEAIKTLISLNPNLNITIKPYAVGAADKTEEFENMPDESMGKITGSEFQNEVKGKNRIQVSMRSLDSMLETGEIPLPDLIKIDVEGAEKEVLKGAQKLLTKQSPQLFLEIHSSKLFSESCALLKECGYGITVLKGSGPSKSMKQDIIHVYAQRNR